MIQMALFDLESLPADLGYVPWVTPEPEGAMLSPGPTLDRYTIPCQYCGGDLESSDGKQWACANHPKHFARWHVCGNLIEHGDRSTGAAYFPPEFANPGRSSDTPPDPVAEPTPEICRFCAGKLIRLGSSAWACTDSIHHRFWLHHGLAVWDSSLKSERGQGGIVPVPDWAKS